MVVLSLGLGVYLITGSLYNNQIEMSVLTANVDGTHNSEEPELCTETIPPEEPTEYPYSHETESSDESRHIEIDNWFTDYSYKYKEMQYADAEIVELLRESYRHLDFSVEFKKGDFSNFDIIVEEFRRLLKMEDTLIDRETGEEKYLNEIYPPLVQPDEWIDSGYNLRDECLYYAFDFDGDGTPEILLQCPSNILVFKYVPERGKFMYWHHVYGWYRLAGSGKCIRVHNAWRDFYKLDTEGGIEWSTSFMEIPNYDFELDEWGVEAYIVFFPECAYMEGQMVISEEVKRQGYYEYEYRGEGEKVYFFRVTAEQYEELSSGFYAAWDIIWDIHYEMIEEVAEYSYDELLA